MIITILLFIIGTCVGISANALLVKLFSWLLTLLIPTITLLTWNQAFIIGALIYVGSAIFKAIFS